jgi:hypothetical protein
MAVCEDLSVFVIADEISRHSNASILQRRIIFRLNDNEFMRVCPIISARDYCNSLTITLLFSSILECRNRIEALCTNRTARNQSDVLHVDKL